MNTEKSRSPFRGSAALASGRLTRHALYTAHRRIFPDVYVGAGEPVTADILVSAASLWAPAGSVICGLAAARVHGERYYSPEALLREVDVYTLVSTRPPSGIRTRLLRTPLPSRQVHVVGGVTVTSIARTAIDVARWEDDDERAIAKVDAVCNRSRTEVSEVRALASELAELHGLRRVRKLLGSCDHRADSPRETRCRLLLTRSQLPAATPQVTIYNEYGVKVTVADFAYPEERVAIFYDGEVHRRRSTWEHDARVNAELAELGWQVIRITAQMLRSPAALMRQIEAALQRGRSMP